MSWSDGILGTHTDGIVVVAKRHKDSDAAVSEELALRILPAGIGPRLVGVLMAIW